MKIVSSEHANALNESFCEFLMLSIISVSISAKSHSCGSGMIIFSTGLGKKWHVGLNLRPFAPRIGRPFLLMPKYCNFESLSWCLNLTARITIENPRLFYLLDTWINAPVVLKYILFEFAVFCVEFWCQNPRVWVHGNVELSFFMLNSNHSQTDWYQIPHKMILVKLILSTPLYLHRILSDILKPDFEIKNLQRTFSSGVTVSHSSFRHCIIALTAFSCSTIIDD